MTKRELKKSNEQVGNVSENVEDMVVNIIANEGDNFGDAIIEAMPLTDVNPIKMGVVAVGLAKAEAALKVTAEVTGIDIAKLYTTQYRHYKRSFEKEIVKLVH